MLCELAVQVAVDNDRVAVVELDQHASGACLVDLCRAELHARRPVGVAVELAVQLLGLRISCGDLLAEAQLPDLVLAERAEVGGKHRGLGFAERLGEHPAGIAREPPGVGCAAVAVEERDQRVERAVGDLADRGQLIERAERQLAAAEHLLRPLRQREDLHSRGHALARPAERLRRAVLAETALEHRVDRLGLLVGVELLARDVLDRAVGVLAVDIADHDWQLAQAEFAGRGDAVKASDQFVAVRGAAHDDGDEHALQADRAGERADVHQVELAHVVGHVDLLQQQSQCRDGLCGGSHLFSFGCRGRRVRPRSPAPCTRRVRSWGEGREPRAARGRCPAPQGGSP